MDTHEAVTLIAAAVPRRPGTWVEFGAGDGTFTRALVELLGPHSRIYAIDRDARAVAVLKRWAAKEAATVTPVVADFTRPFDLGCARAAESCWWNTTAALPVDGCRTRSR